VSGIDAFLRALDDAWAHDWESIQTVLRSVGEEEAAYQAPCYRGVKQDAGWPLPGTILWQIAHLAWAKEHYAECLRHRREPKSPKEHERRPAGSLAEELLALKVAHANERAEVAACADAELGERVGGRMLLAEFLSLVARHDAWHASQIAVARRLWRERGD